jgi:hypothetical protein
VLSLGFFLLLVSMVAGLMLLARPRNDGRRVLGFGLAVVAAALVLQQAMHGTVFGLPLGRWMTGAVDWIVDWLANNPIAFLPALSGPDMAFLRRPAEVLPPLLNVLLVTVAGLVWWLISRRAEVSAPAVPDFLRRDIMRQLYAALLIMLLLVIWLPQLFLLFGFSILPNLREITKDLFWSALAVPLGLICGATREVKVDVSDTPLPPSTPGAAATGDIQGFLSMLQMKYAACLLKAPRTVIAQSAANGSSRPGGRTSPLVRRILDTLERPAEGRPALGPAQRASLARDLERITADPATTGARRRNALCEEDLAAIHFIVLAELIQSVQDRGGVALVVAPAAAVARVDGALRKAIDEHAGGLSVRTCRLDSDTFDTAQRYSLLLASDDTVDSVLLQGAAEPRHQAAWRCLSQLALLVVIDFHLLDAALLRLRIGAMADRLGDRPVQVFCQSERRAGLGAAVQNCFESLATGEFERIRLVAAAGCTRHVVLWRNDAASADALSSKVLGQPAVRDQRISPAALIAWEALQFDIRVVALDGATRDRAGWSRLAEMLGHGTDERVQELSRIEQGMAGFPRPGSRLLLCDDRGNLAEALARNGNFNGEQEHVLFVFSRDYALRDFMADRLGGGASEELLLPIAPASAGGATECAVVLAGELANSRMVSQRRVEDLFRRLIARDVRQAFAIEPTPAGVDRLFQRETTHGVALERVVNDRHEVLLSLSATFDAPAAPQLTAAARLGTGRPVAQLSRGDHGLAYARTTKILRDGQRFLIKDVQRDSVTLEVDATDHEPRQTYLFHRQYKLRFADDLPPLEPAEKLDGDIFELRRILLRGDVARQTCAIARRWELMPPATAGKSVLWNSADVPAPRGDATVLLLRYSFGGDTDMNPLLDEATLPHLAFTLAALLQDVLASLFPGMGHRFAVLSPQAAPAVAAALSAPPGSAQRFPVERFPRLLRPDDATAFGVGAAPAPSAEIEARITAFLELLSDRARSAGGGPVTHTGLALARHIDLLVIEDADHDLGALRAVHSAGWSQLAAVWHGFAAWTAQHKDDQQFHYRYGGGVLPDIFDFPAAAAFLDRVLPDGEKMPAGQRSGMPRHG